MDVQKELRLGCQIEESNAKVKRSPLIKIIQDCAVLLSSLWKIFKEKWSTFHTYLPQSMWIENFSSKKIRWLQYICRQFSGKFSGSVQCSHTHPRTTTTTIQHPVLWLWSADGIPYELFVYISLWFKACHQKNGFFFPPETFGWGLWCSSLCNRFEVWIYRLRQVQCSSK